MRNHVLSALMALAVIAAPGAWAQGSAADGTDMQALRTAAKTDKRALVASTLALTDAEAKKFWPIYDTYQRSLNLANRERTLAVEDFVEFNRPMTDAFAKQLSREILGADDIELRARRTLYGKMMKALPPKKAFRYLQLESKIRAVQAYDIAATIPLAK